MPGTRKLGRPTDQRNAMLRGMVTYLLENGKIETTLTRAKEVAPIAEKMITLGKKGTLEARRKALSYITKEDVVRKLFDETAKRYESRAGGYTQIFKLGARRGDAAEMALLRLWVDEKKEEKKASAAKTKTTRKRTAKASDSDKPAVKTAESSEAVEETAAEVTSAEEAAAEEAAQA